VPSKQCHQFFVGIFDVCHVHAKKPMTKGAPTFDRYAIVELGDQDLSCWHQPSLRRSTRLSSAAKSLYDHRSRSLLQQDLSLLDKSRHPPRLAAQVRPAYFGKATQAVP